MSVHEFAIVVMVLFATACIGYSLWLTMRAKHWQTVNDKSELTGVLYDQSAAVCKNCVYSQHSPGSTWECHRHAPIAKHWQDSLHPKNQAIWPDVWEGATCGDFRSKRTLGFDFDKEADRIADEINGKHPSAT